MIRADDECRIFEFHGQHSFYAMRVDEEGLLLQIGHGGRAEKSPVCSSGYVYTEWPGNLMELPAYGDLAQDEVVLKAEFLSVSGPIRDLRTSRLGSSFSGPPAYRTAQSAGSRFRPPRSRGIHLECPRPPAE